MPGGARTGHLFTAGAVLLLAGAVAAWGGKTSRYRVSDEPTKDWREGPVRYIITKSEDNEFRRLDSEADRRVFIERFWIRRDPTPETPGNEFRAQFWKRVRQANSLYGKETTRPGWLTDMGKIHILFGPPDEIQRDEMPEGHRGIIVWIYRNSPRIAPSSPASGPNQVLAFAQDATGEYRLTAEPSKVAGVWEGLADPQPPVGPMKHIIAQQRFLQNAYARMIGLTDPVIRQAGGPITESPLGLTMALGSLQQPPEEWNLDAEVTTREFFGSLPFRARADFLRAPDAAGSLVILSVGVRSTSVTYRDGARGSEPAVEVFGRILDSTSTNLVASLEQPGDFAAARENARAGLDDDLLFQARAHLPAGTYIARLTIVDQVSGRTGTSDSPFTVPAFPPDGLNLSSVLLSRSLDAVQGTRPPGLREIPFELGSLRVLPRLGQEFCSGEELTFYYQIYGMGRDPSSGTPRLKVTYIFLAGDREELSEAGRIGFENQSADAHGYALPLAGWPVGSYLLRIEVEDAVGGGKAARDVAFRITGDCPS